MPRIEDRQQSVKNNEFMSKAYLSSGFNQIPINETGSQKILSL